MVVVVEVEEEEEEGRERERRATRAARDLQFAFTLSGPQGWKKEFHHGLQVKRTWLARGVDRT